ERKRSLDEGDGEIGLMEGSAASAVVPKKCETFRVHPLRARIDAAVAHPRRIADHDVETAAGHDVREVNVERKKADLAVLDALQRAAIGDDAFAQFAAAFDVH